MKRFLSLYIFAWLLLIPSVCFAVQSQGVFVNGVQRAIKHYDSSSNVIRVELFYDSGVTDYGNADTTGSIAWAMGLMPTWAENTTMAGEIYIHASPNDYPMYSPVTLKDGVKISGAGQNRTWLKRTTGADSPFFSYNGANPLTRPYIGHMKLDGDEANNSSSEPAIKIEETAGGDSLEFGTIEYLYITRFNGHGIVIEEAWRGWPKCIL